MSRKKKQAFESSVLDSDCANCIDALVQCVYENNPATRAMYKDKAHSACQKCGYYQSIEIKTKNR